MSAYNKFNRVPVINVQKTAKNLSVARISAGLSVKDVQEAFGYSSSQLIRRWENGKCLPCAENLVILSHIYDVPVDNLLDITMVGQEAAPL